MAKQQMLILKGLPASGKSTYAKTLSNQNYIRVSKTDIAKNMFGRDIVPKSFKSMPDILTTIIDKIISEGKNVVVDDMNLDPKDIRELEDIAKKLNITVEINDTFTHVALDELISRDLQRHDSVGENKIRSLFHKYIKYPKKYYPYIPELDMAVICDIDGTLAHMNKRGPYEWDKVSSDEIDVAVAHLVDALKLIDYAKIFLFSGRSDICRADTEEWLERHDIEYDELFMRPDGDNRKDTNIKAEMLEAHVRGKYNVLFVIDDRPQVCRMYRDVYGLKVLQVTDPYVEF